MPTLQHSSQLEEWGDESFMYDEGSYLYKISRIINSLQYVAGKSIVRIWNEELLNYDFVNRIKEANRIEDMINDTLIVEIDGEQFVDMFPQTEKRKMGAEGDVII